MTEPEPTYPPVTSDAFAAPKAVAASTAVAAPVIRRVIAAAVDLVGTIVVTAIVVLICLLIGLRGANSSTGAETSFAFVLGRISIFLVPLVIVVANIRLAHTGMYTVGMRFTRLRVVDVSTNGPAGLVQIIKRAAVLLVPALISLGAVSLFWDVVIQAGRGNFTLSVLSPIGFVAPVVWFVLLVPMLQGDRRGFQDRIAGTRVITAASAG